MPDSNTVGQRFAQELYDALLDHGWSMEGARFLRDQWGDPRTLFIYEKLVPNRTYEQAPLFAMPKSDWLRADVREQIFKRSNYVCQHCGTPDDLSVDHIVPRSRGGTNEPDNLQLLCRSCNTRKGAR